LRACFWLERLASLAPPRSTLFLGWRLLRPVPALELSPTRFAVGEKLMELGDDVTCSIVPSLISLWSGFGLGYQGVTVRSGLQAFTFKPGRYLRAPEAWVPSAQAKGFGELRGKGCPCLPTDESLGFYQQGRECPLMDVSELPFIARGDEQANHSRGKCHSGSTLARRRHYRSAGILPALAMSYAHRNDGFTELTDDRSVCSPAGDSKKRLALNIEEARPAMAAAGDRDTSHTICVSGRCSTLGKLGIGRTLSSI